MQLHNFEKLTKPIVNSSISNVGYDLQVSHYPAWILNEYTHPSSVICHSVLEQLPTQIYLHADAREMYLYTRDEILAWIPFFFTEELCMMRRSGHECTMRFSQYFVSPFAFVPHELTPVLDPKLFNYDWTARAWYLCCMKCNLLTNLVSIVLLQSGKGCVGGVIWACWYDELDGFLDQDNAFNFFKLFGIVTYQWIKPYLGAFKTILSILI